MSEQEETTSGSQMLHDVFPAVHGAQSAWMSAIAPIIWRLPALGVVLPKEAKPIEDYGMRIFRNPAYLRSLTPEEKALRELPP